MIKISELHEEVKAIQKDMPNVIYKDRLKELSPDKAVSACLYSANNKPACIIGFALHNLGASITQLNDYDDLSESGILEVVAHYDEDFEIDDYSLLEHLGRIQQDQDRGEEWSDCG